MSPATSRRLLLLALASLPPFPFAVAQHSPAAPASQAATAEKIARFEQMLVRSPGPGRAFDEVFGHYFATEGVAALRDRWTAARDAAPAGSSDAAAYALLLGQLAERIGDSDTARARYTEAAAATPKDFRPFHRLGRLEIRDNKLPAGIAALEKAAALDLPPTDAQDVLRDLARARSRAFDEAGALAAWKDLATRFPDDALVLEEVGQAQLDAAAYDEAAATFTALEKSAGGDAYRAVLARLRLGEVAARKGDKDAALARFSAALDGTHRDSWLHREAQARVDALFREKGDFDGLIAFHEARLSGASRDPAAARRLADLLIELNRTDKALEWFDKATGWAPDDHALRFEHIRALLAAKRDADALPLLQSLVKRHPSQAAYREALGQLHWDRAKAAAETNPTLAASERVLALETWAGLAPANAPVADLLALAELYRTHDLPDETRATLARALAVEPASYDLRERLALQLLAMKRDDEAWAVARNAPAGLTDAGQYRRLASLEKRNDLLKESLASIDRGLALAPDNYELLDLRWQVLTALARWDDALALFPKLLTLAPGDYARDTVESRHLSALRSADKLDATLTALAQRITDEDPSLTEADHRLHIRLILAQSVPLEADAAFAAAKKRFPDSFSIAQLEADHLERTAPLADRTAALRRLAVLRPERAPEWLRRLVNTHRFDGDFDGARKAVAELVALAPADAQNHVLAAELEFDAGQSSAGLDALQRALRLASDPAPVRARLARAHLENSRPAAALAIYEEAFYAAADDNARRAFLAPMTEAAVQANDLEGLLTRFAERNRPRRDTAAYHIELGEIRFNAQDFPAAQDAWNRALDLRRDDPRLLARLLDLARKNSDSVAVARLVRLRHELDPSPANAIELAESLIETDANDEAMQLFLAHAAYFYSDTSLLPRLLPALVARDLADPLIERLRNEAAAAVDPLDRDFVLATAFITIRDFERAESLLWSVYNTPPAPVAPNVPATPPPAGSTTTPAVPAHVLLQQQAFTSVQQTAQGYQAALQLLQNQGGRSFRSYRGNMMGLNPNMPASTTRAQDTALGYLGALAVQQDKAPAFLARLETELEKRRVPASRRVHEFIKVQARDAALRHLPSALAEPSPDTTAFFLAQNLIYERDPYTGAQLPLSPENEALLKSVQDALEKLGPPLNAFQKLQQRLSRLQHGPNPDLDAAFALLLEAKALPALSEGERQQLVRMDLYLRMQTKRWDDFLPVLADAIAKEPSLHGDQVIHFVTAFLARNDGEAATVSDAQLDTVANLLLDAYAKPAPATAATHQQALRLHTRHSTNAQHELHMLLTYGAPIGGANQGMDHQLKQLATALDKNRDTFLPRLLALGAKRDAEGLRTTRTLVLRLALAFGDTRLAESVGSELLATHPEPGLLFNLAELAFRDDRPDIAKSRYEAVTPSSGTLAIAAQSRLLEIALNAKDTEAAKTAVTKLVRLRPPSHLPNVNLAETLRELGLDKTLQTPSSRTRAATNGRQSRNEELNRLNNQLNSALNKKDFAAAEPLAHRLLASVPLTEARRGNDYQRRNALGAFVRAGLMDAYIADLDAQLARAPNSALALELLAEAHRAIRQAGNSNDRALAPVAVSDAPLALPVRIRLQRRGQTFVASHAPVLFTGPAVSAAVTDPADTSLGYEPAWTKLGAVDLPDFNQPEIGLTARNQNVRSVADARFTDIHLAGRVVPAADFNDRSSFTFGGQSTVFYRFSEPFSDGASVELTLDAPATAKARVPLSRGLLLRDPSDNRPRAALFLTEDGKLAFTAHRETKNLELDYLARLVGLRPRDEHLRSRYIESLLDLKRTADAIAFIEQPANEDLLLRYAAHSRVIDHHRKAGTLDAFAARASERAVAAGNRPGQYPQIDYNILQLARHLRDAGDTSAALVVWEKILPALRDHQSGEVRVDFVRALLALDTPVSRARAGEVVRDQFITPQRVSAPPPPIFRDHMHRYHQQPWYAQLNISGARIQTNAGNLLESVDDPEFLRALISENAPRLAAPDAGWEPRCYDLALKLRAGDLTAPAAFVALWNDAVAAASKPPAATSGFSSGQSPLNGFLPACLERFTAWPDPNRDIEKVFRSFIDGLPKTNALAGVVAHNAFANFAHNPWMQHVVRLSWADYHLGQGDTAAHRQALLDLAGTISRGDSRQTNASVVAQIFGRLVALGNIPEARTLYEKTLLRIRRTQGHNLSSSPWVRHYADVLDALEGKGDAPAPALAAWISPAPDGTPWLRWEITARLSSDKNTNDSAVPPVFGQALPAFPDGAYDLVIELLAPGKDEVRSSFTLPAIATRGGQRLDTQLEGDRFRASLRPREGSGRPGVTAAPQLFSVRPNLLANPEARISGITTVHSRLHTPGWTLPFPAVSYPGGPSVEGRTVRFVTLPSHNSERFTRSAPFTIDPKGRYLLSAWALTFPEENGEIGIEFLDATGKVLNQTATRGVHNQDLRWERVTLSFGVDQRRQAQNNHRIPAEAVAMRVWITGQPGLHLSELTVQALSDTTVP